MVRKTKEASEHTYACLLEAAERVFFEKGVANTTLNDIALAAGLTRGAIYWHFKDKASLLQALFAQASLPMETMLDALSAAPSSDPMGTIRSICLHSLTTLAESTQRQRIFTIMFHRCESVGEVAQMMDKEMECRDECLGRMRRLLEQAVQVGQLPTDTDVFLCMQIVHNFMVGSMHQWLVSQPSYPLAKMAPAMVDALLAGIRTAPPRLAAP